VEPHDNSVVHKATISYVKNEIKMLKRICGPKKYAVKGEY